ncbi:MAG: hypothetical protein HY909_20245 [Deltaproteobacteria bacterium]|nr:hypothetical protein [Deltaproteobacteria bacterium]
MVLNGNAKNVTREIVDFLDQLVLGGDLFVSRSLDEGVEIARTIVFRGYGTVLTGGGDGTFVHMVTHVVKEARAAGVRAPRVGFLRLGTGNALAWVVGAQAPRKGRGVAADIARLRQDAGFRPMRLLEVDGALTPFAGVGIDATVLHQYNRTKKLLQRTPLKRFAAGALGYTLAISTQTLPGYLFARVPRVKVVNVGAPALRLGVDGRLVGAPVREGETIFEGVAKMVACATIPTYGFGFRIFPFAEERPDRMHLRVVNMSPLSVPQNIVKIWKGTYRDADTVIDVLVDKVRVTTEAPVPFQIGGDPCGERSDVTFVLSEEPIELVDFYAPSPLHHEDSP